jgi:hypothetical protein
VRAVFSELDGTPRLMAALLYGSGLRLLECCRLRIAMRVREAGHVPLGGGVPAQAQHGGFGERPLQMRVADAAITLPSWVVRRRPG